MKKENKKIWISLIIVIALILIFIGSIIYINYITTDRNNNKEDNKNSFLGSTHKLIDYRINECIEVSDGMICLAIDYTKDNDNILVKINDDSDIVWKKSIYTDKELNEKELGDALSCNKTGICAFASSYINESTATEQGLMILYNNQGDKIWENEFDEHYIFSIHDIQIVEDGIIVVGDYRDKNKNYYNGFVSKYDLNGDLLWKTEYNQEVGSVFYSITVSNDDSIYVAGHIDSSKSPIDLSRGLLIKINEFGQIVWDKVYEDDQVSSSYYDILINKKGEIIVLGERDKTTQNLTQQTIILNYDSEGEKINEHIYLEEKIEKIYLDNQNKIVGYGIRENSKYANKEKQLIILDINDNLNITDKIFLDITKYEFIIDIVQIENNWMIMTLTKESDDKTAIISIKNEELFKTK